MENEGEKEKANVEMSIVQLALNIHIPDSRFAVGFSVGTSCGVIDSKNALMKAFSLRCEDETGIDLQYAYKDNLWLTLGQGRYRESGLTPFENVIDGFGGAITIFRKGKLISRPFFGYYLSENGQNMFLLTTTFYEE